MDTAQLWQLVALLFDLDPDSIRIWNEDLDDRTRFVGATKDFTDCLQIAESSVLAGKLACLTPGMRPCFNQVLMTEFLRWAQSKALPIPTELKPPEWNPSAPTAPEDSTSIEGIDGLRDLIKTLGGPVLGDPAAVRSFAKNAGIMEAGDNPQRVKRTWRRSEIEPSLKAAIEKWRQKGAQ